MLRFMLLTPVVLAIACGGHRAPPRVAPAAQAHDTLPPAPSLAGALVLPPAPSLDTVVPAEELAAESRIAADSAADEAVLEALDEARPSDDETEEPLPPTPVSWDIDVDTYTSHDRVQYYLDFFQGKGRERMGIWLTRMPRYEGMIRERLQGEGLPGRPGLPRAHRERLLQHRHQPRQSGGDVAVHEGHGAGLRAPGGLVGGRAARSVPRHRGRGPASQDLNRPVRLAVPGGGCVQRRRGQGLARSQAPARRRRGRLAQLRRHLLPPLRHQAAPPRDQGLRAEADRRRAHRQGADALRLRHRHARARRLRFRRGADHDRARRHRAAGRHHGRRDPRAQPAVPPAGDAPRRPVGGARAAGPRRVHRGGICRAAAVQADHVRRALRGAG